MNTNKKPYLFIICYFILAIILTNFSYFSLQQNVHNDENSKTDRAGNFISISQNVNRIVSLAPSVTQILMDFGLTENFIATDTHSHQMFDLPDLPTFDMLHPEIESLISLQPDLIIATTMTFHPQDLQQVINTFANFNITLAFIPTSETIADIIEDVRFLGSITGKYQISDNLIMDFEHELDTIKNSLSNLKNSPQIYFEISPAPHIFSFGTGVFLHEMIELSGGENIFVDQIGWFAVEPESLISRNPEIIFTNAYFLANPVDEIKSRPGFSELNAVTNNRIYFIDHHQTNLPTLRILDGIRTMAEIILKGQ